MSVNEAPVTNETKHIHKEPTDTEQEAQRVALLKNRLQSKLGGVEHDGPVGSGRVPSGRQTGGGTNPLGD